jgi:hypothetical protein
MRDEPREIEVTPRMIAAGAAALRHFDADMSDPLSEKAMRDLLTAIFRAMVAARSNRTASSV